MASTGLSAVSSDTGDVEETVIVVTGQIATDAPVGGGGASYSPIGQIVMEKSDPFSDVGGKSLITKATLAPHTIKLNGFSFEINMNSADFTRMKDGQEGAYLKLFQEYTQSSEFRNLMQYYQNEGVDHIYIHFDGYIYDANGRRRGEMMSSLELGKTAYKANDAATSGVDIISGTDVHISLNPAALGNTTNFIETLIHELYHPMAPGVGGSDERACDNFSDRVHSNIFVNQTTGALENDELSYANSTNTLGSMYADAIVGGSGNDFVSGKEGADNINGGAGNDQLFGGAGMDTITSGSGQDRLWGGGDADKFIISSTNSYSLVSDTGGVDTLNTGGMSFNEAHFTRINNTLFISQDGRTIQVDRQWATSAQHFEQFVFAEGTYAASLVEAQASGAMCYENGRPVICTGGFGTPVVFASTATASN